MGTLTGRSGAEPSQPRRPATARSRGGACVVVGARESRVQGEGRQKTGRLAATEEPPVDSGDQVDEAWLLGIQRKLYQWSRNHPDGCYRVLWNWVTDPRNLRCAWRRVARNKGSRTAGVDGMTVANIRSGRGEAAFVADLRNDLRAGRYRPSPCRRKFIPEPGQPGKYRPPGHPDRARPRCSMRGQEPSGADLRGILLARVVRVPARTRVSRRLGAHPHDHASPGEGQRWSPPPDALRLGHRG